MNFLEFLFLLMSASAITFVLLSLGEKMIRSVASITIGPVVLLLGSLVFTYSILFFIKFLLPYNFQMSYFLLAGMIIILNRFWFSHFSKTNEKMKAFPLHDKRFAK